MESQRHDTGKPTSGGPEKNQMIQVVLDVTDGLRGHNVNCFTSYELSQQLLKRKMVGTVRKNKLELPLHSSQQGGEKPSQSLPSPPPPL